MEEAKHDTKIKFVCRMKDNVYQQDVYLDHHMTQAQNENSAVHGAEIFFSAFSPEHLTKEMTARYGERFVLVFRTTETQMQNFCDILTE